MRQGKCPSAPLIDAAAADGDVKWFRSSWDASLLFLEV